MTPFIIVADLRTGSTLLHSSLDGHPDVRCYGELFHPDDLPDNQLPDRRRHDLTGGEVIRRAFAVEGVRAAGFRAMIFLPLPSEPQWADAWECLRSLSDLHVIYLTRRDRLAQYASMVVAQQTGAWHPSSHDPILKPENRPQITIDPEQYRRWIDEREQIWTQRRTQLAGKPSLELDYETLTGQWPETTARVQEFLGVPCVPLQPAKQKQETRPLSEVIANYEELAS